MSTSGVGKSRSMWATLVPLTVAELGSAFVVSMIYACLPTLHRQFDDNVGVGWVITACLLVSSIAAALCGRLGDLLGRRRVLIVVLALCAAGSLISALSSTLAGVIVGASLQGVSGAILPLCFGLVRERLPQQQVPFGVSVVVAAAALGAGSGLFLGGLIIDHFSWHGIFFSSCATAAAGALAILLFIPHAEIPMASREGLDMITGVLFAPAIAGLLFALSKMRDWGWSDPRVWVTAVASTLALALWARHQARQTNPLINVRLFVQPKIALAFGCMAMLGVGCFQLAQIMSLFLQQPAWTGGGLGLTATVAGLILLPVSWIGMFSSPVSGKIAERHGARTAALVGAALMTTAWALLTLSHDDLWIVITAVMLNGIAHPMIYAAVPNMVLEAVPAERTSEISGVLSVVRAVAMAVGAQLVTILLATDTVPDPLRESARFATDTAYTSLFAYVAITGVLCWLFAWLSPKRTPPGNKRRTEVSIGHASRAH